MEPKSALRHRLRTDGSSQLPQLLPFRCALLAVAFVVMSSCGPAAAAQAAPNGSERASGGTSPAQAFCNSTKGRALQCGWASDDELTAAGADCLWCSGTIWWGEAPTSLPANLSTGGRSYYQEASHYVSLGCDGPVVVRAVTKLTDAGDFYPEYANQDCALDYLEGAWNQDGDILPVTVVRCELQLPNGTQPEEQRALQAKEVNCYNCTRCSDGGGCPSKLGVWYSDSFTYNATGCASLLSGQQPQASTYSYVMPIVAVNPTVEFTLAKFEVCSGPPCYDAAYEAAKLKNAKQCAAAKCPK